MNWEILIAVLGALGGIEGVRYLLNWRANRRSELARATGSELQTLKETCVFLQQQLLEKEQRFAEQTKRLRETQDTFFKEKERRHKLELELSVKRCNDIHCPFREPPTPHTPPRQGLTKEMYHNSKTSNDMNTVKFGSKGADVLTLQKALNGEGHSIGTDGVFGTKTEAAVKDYQRKNGLTADGIAGPKTWSRLGYDTLEKPESRLIDEIILHCSATPEGRDVSSATINAGHKARKFSSYRDPKTGQTMHIGYHYLIHPDGRIEACRPESVRGCHASGHNANSIGICFIGGYASDGKTVKDTRTPQQKASIESLLARLCTQLPIKRIIGHRDTSPDLNGNGIIEPFEWLKACPCFDAKKEYEHILRGNGQN